MVMEVLQELPRLLFIRHCPVRYCIGLLLTLLCLAHAIGQQSLSGVVTDLNSGEPLIGVTVIERESGVGTTTNFDGVFDLELDALDGILEVSYIGYKTQQFSIEGRSKCEISLEVEGVTFDEVVVTGLDIKRQKRALGYSTDKLEGKELLLSNGPNVINALSGKSAGVNITNANGVDGGTTRIIIRGNNNIKGNNQPLIVIDGVPLENTPGLTDVGRGKDWGSAINQINPEDIEEMNILKGPTAAAKYGTRGANGVILIRTKRGSNRNGLGIQYAITYKHIQPYRYRDVQNTYGAGGPTSLLEPSFNTNAQGEFVYPNTVHTNNGPFGRPTTEQFGFYSTGMSWGPPMEGQMVRWWDGELREFTPQPDNLRQFFSSGSTVTHNLNFSGGNEKTTTRVSFTAQNHDAVIPNSNFQQYTANLGSNLAISEKLEGDVAISYMNFNRKNSPSLGDDNNASFGKGILYSWPRSYKGLEESLNSNPDGSRFEYNGQYPFTYTPNHLWWNTYNQNTYLTRNKLLGSVGLKYKPTTWLSISGRTGLDFNLNEFEERFNPFDASGVNGAKYSNELQRDQVNNSEILVTATKENIGSSRIGASLSIGGNRWSRSQYGINATAENWVNPWLFTFNNYETVLEDNLPSEIRFDKKIHSLFAFLNLNYGKALYVELSGRNDWSSSLPLENNSYFYPSASVSFIVNEAITLPFEWLTFWKLRAAYAQTANDTDPFLLDFVYDTGTFGGQQTATQPSTKPPVELSPQLANSYEFGTTLGLFQDKVNLDLTYYYIKSFDQILESPVPTSSGVNQVRINSGVLENKGIELSVSANLFQNAKSHLATGLNLSRNRNAVVSLGDGAKTLELANIWGNFGPNISVREGEQYGTIYGYDYVYHESSNQPIVNEAGTHYLISDNLVPVGNAAPDVTGGWTVSGRYKNIRFSSLIDAKIGGDIYAGSYVIGLQTGQSPETLYEREGNGLPYEDPNGEIRNIGVVLPGVQADGSPNNQVVHYYYKYLPNAGGWGKLLTTPGVLNNTWVKWRELGLNYSIPLKSQQFLQELEVSLVGRDLFYIYSSLPDRINPEGSNGSGNAQGLEWASFPGMRSISLRVSCRL